LHRTIFETAGKLDRVLPGPLAHRIHHGMTLSLYYMDPDGNRIELQVDCFDSEGAIAFMKSPAFAENPLGVEIDPDALLLRYRQGASHEDLIARPVGPMSAIPLAHGVT
jgi:hypothetical protein